jgi:hypothetical protein
VSDLTAKVIADVRPYTKTPDEALECTIRLTLEAIDSGIPGDLVECGVWMGGCSFAMLLAQRYAYGEIRRPVWMYDSFEGMSPPSPEDGDLAAHWWVEAQNRPKDRVDNDYCIAPIDKVMAAGEQLGLGPYVHIRDGWLAKTLPVHQPINIAILRIDCDWFQPVKCVFDHLAPKVSPGGSIIVDDYYAWEGARLATHEYLAKHKRPWPIASIAGQHGATLRVQ